MTLHSDFETKLARYAELLVRTGVNLPDGGKLLVQAPLDAAPLVRLVTRTAYRAGAVDVRVVYGDPHLNLALFEDGSEAAVDYLPVWQAQQREAMVADGYASIGIVGEDPALLAGVDSGRIARRSKLLAQAMKAVSEATGGFEVNWTVAAMSTPAWASRVYPDLPEAQAVARLWDDIFKVTRADQPDPVAAWDAHLTRLERLTAFLNAKQYAAIHLKSDLGTDLTVGLAEGHIWQGGAETAKNGVRGVPNLPTDEVFTAPHRERVDGVAVASKPLSARGQLIEGIRVRFEGGRAVEVSASQGEETLKQLIDTDEGAARLGEIALVAASAPVAQTGTLFLNTLFDENAASHIALGRCYPTNVQHGENPEALLAAGGNDSLIHVDWMIGTPGTDVDGVTADGSREALMRGGEWVVEGREGPLRSGSGISVPVCGTMPPMTSSDAYQPAGFTPTPELSSERQTKFSQAPELGDGIDPGKTYRAVMETSKGRLVIELYADDAPVTVNSFAYLIRHHYYDGIKFHRVIDGFMAQGGDPTGTGSGGPGYGFEDEFGSQHRHDGKGVLSMANRGPATNGSQFFITFGPTPHLDGKHTVFGRVVEGLDVLDRLTRIQPGMPGRPDVIERAYLVEKNVES